MTDILQRLLNQLADTDAGVDLVVEACDSLLSQQATTAEEKLKIRFVKQAAADRKWNREFASRHEVAA